MAAIPPDPEAIRAAMAAPEKGKRGQVLMGTLLVVALAVIFVQNTDGEPVSKSGSHTGHAVEDGADVRQRYVEPFNHLTAFRFLMPLAPNRRGQSVEFEALMSFGYTVYRSDVDAAQSAIDRNWNATAKRIGRYLSNYDKVELIDRIESINEDIKTLMNETMFPGGLGQVQTVTWREMTFRPRTGSGSTQPPPSPRRTGR